MPAGEVTDERGAPHLRRRLSTSSITSYAPIVKRRKYTKKRRSFLFGTAANSGHFWRRNFSL